MFRTSGAKLGSTTEKLLEPDDQAQVLNCYCRQKKKTTTKTTSQIRSIALIFFLLACLYWLYKVYTNATSHNSDRASGQVDSRAKLKLISVFNRHGDRSPSDSLPPGDEFNQRPKFFWPNGLTNLTDSGKFRQFRVGLELRKRYEDLLDYNASHYLAFSSPIYRCQESLEQTLRGLFDIDWPLSRGLKLIDQYNADVAGNRNCFATVSSSNDTHKCELSKQQHLILPNGAGSPLEFNRIEIDTKTLPQLTYQFINNCKYRLEHPTPVDKNLSASESIAQLAGIKKLQDILATKYSTGWEFEALGLYSTLGSEIRLARTTETINYGSRNFEWVTKRVPEYNSTRITLFDLYEQVALLGYRDRIVGTADYIQLGPLISSMVISQQIALGQLPATGANLKPSRATGSTFDSANLYADKKAILYSSHDSILQLLLHRLGFINANAADYEKRFSDWHEADDVDQLLSGLRMIKFGMSLVFELYEMDLMSQVIDGDQENISGEKFAFVQASLYNQEDGKYKPIEYRKLKLGQICRRLFQEQNPSSDSTELDETFYKQEVSTLDRYLSCPFELFKNVTSRYMIDSIRLDELCRT